jgi:hypothetical protein
MRNIIVTLVVVLMGTVLGSPHITHAYLTTHQTAKKLNAHAAVFAIEYAFGLKDNDLYMPVLADRTASGTANTKHLSYSIIEEGDEVTTVGAAQGIVVSKAPIIDEMYKLEAGKAQKMTLIVLLILPDDIDEANYAVQVDSLPFFEDEGSKPLTMRQLNPSELQYYLTPEVELNTGVRK